MSNALDPTFEQHKLLKTMYRSEAYALLLSIIDAKMLVEYKKIMSDIKDSDMVNTVNKMKGMKETKEILFNIIKEGEGRYEQGN